MCIFQNVGEVMWFGHIGGVRDGAGHDAQYQRLFLNPY